MFDQLAKKIHSVNYSGFRKFECKTGKLMFLHFSEFFCLSKPPLDEKSS